MMVSIVQYLGTPSYHKNQPVQQPAKKAKEAKETAKVGSAS
ncbi:hypothetical protein N9D66_00600 [Candidatus Nanopelagicales bacterium]|nr:hypothetical protein [Candidatus Nanopelagicales bacterium]